MSKNQQGRAGKTPGLRLKRKVGERVRLKIGDTVIWIDIAEILGIRVMLAFSAPRAVEIFREECLPCEQ